MKRERVWFTGGAPPLPKTALCQSIITSDKSHSQWPLPIGCFTFVTIVTSVERRMRKRRSKRESERVRRKRGELEVENREKVERKRQPSL